MAITCANDYQTPARMVDGRFTLAKIERASRVVVIPHRAEGMVVTVQWSAPPETFDESLKRFEALLPHLEIYVPPPVEEAKK